MKRLIFFLIIVLSIAGLAHAQLANMNATYGVGYGFYSYTETDGVLNATTSMQGPELLVGNFIGEELGFYQRALIGLVTGISFTVDDGTTRQSSEPLQTDGSIVYNLFQLGPGYRLPVDETSSVLLSVGPSVTSALSLSTDFTFATMSLGVGADVQFEYTIGGSFKIAAGMGLNYDFYEILSTFATDFVSAVGISPWIGFGY